VLASLLACSAGDLRVRPTPTPPPTRPVAPTFTPTPDFINSLVVVTPPNQGTPGLIVVPPGVDPSSLIPIPATTTSTPSATPSATPPPTATPTAQATETPAEATPLPTATGPTATPQRVGVIIPPPSNTPTASPTATPTPSATPTLTPVPPPPTATPTPYVLVMTGLVNLREGPGVEYPLVAQLGPNIPVAIVGQNPEGNWLQICCVNGGSVWVAREHVQTVNDTSTVGLVLAELPPTATPTGTPTLTPTITPTPTVTPYPFQVAEGPLFFATSNELLTIWVKVFSGAGGGQTPLPGYFLKVLFRNRADGSTFESRPNTKGEAPSKDTFEYNVPPGPGSGNRVQFNYKYEFLPPDPKEEDRDTSDTRATLIDGYWRIYLVDGAGTQLSDAIEFNTLAGNTNREVYVAWMATR
jgi:hypothetical protein